MCKNRSTGACASPGPVICIVTHAQPPWKTRARVRGTPVVRTCRRRLCPGTTQAKHRQAGVGASSRQRGRAVEHRPARRNPLSWAFDCVWVCVYIQDPAGSSIPRPPVLGERARLARSRAVAPRARRPARTRSPQLPARKIAFPSARPHVRALHEGTSKSQVIHRQGGWMDGSVLLHVTANQPQDVGNYYLLEAIEACRRLPGCIGAQ